MQGRTDDSPLLIQKLALFEGLLMQFVRFLVSRFATYLLVMWIGVTVVFFVPRFLPTNPVEAMLGRIMTQGAYMEPEQVMAMRATLTETFGLEGTLLEQYLSFMRRALLSGDFGPSLAMFPTPVNELIGRALPWSMGLLLTTVIIAWLIGSTVGLIVGFQRNKLYSKVLETLAVIVYPIPYYISALILIILFVYIKPVFPLSFNVRGTPPSLEFIGSVIYNSFLPAISIVTVGFGWWVLSMKALSTSIAEEDFVYFARLKGVREGRIMRRYVWRNAILPQITFLALQIGGIFNGALIAEILFGYPGLGTLTQTAVLQADYNLLMGTITISIIAVSTATFVVDLIYPLFDPRVQYR
jgi:peptide/nickel transport system permease protein